MSKKSPRHGTFLTALLVVSCLGGSGEAASAAETIAAAVVPAPHPASTFAEQLAPKLQSGTLLFSEGDCLAIRVFTASPYTHVAIVMVGDEGCTVFDSMNGVGVRKLSLADYLTRQAPEEIHIFHPVAPLTPDQSVQLQAYLESQLGRPYGIQHHLTGERADGIHCAEYATDALMAIHRVHAQCPSKVSPASLVTGITRANVYHAGERMQLPVAEPRRQVGSNWCDQMWIDTKTCCASCCDKLLALFLCR